jgi:hypothetical protein
MIMVSAAPAAARCTVSESSQRSVPGVRVAQEEDPPDGMGVAVVPGVAYGSPLGPGAFLCVVERPLQLPLLRRPEAQLVVFETVQFRIDLEEHPDHLLMLLDRHRGDLHHQRAAATIPAGSEERTDLGHADHVAGVSP